MMIPWGGRRSSVSEPPESVRLVAGGSLTLDHQPPVAFMRFSLQKPDESGHYERRTRTKNRPRVLTLGRFLDRTIGRLQRVVIQTACMTSISLASRLRATCSRRLIVPTGASNSSLISINDLLCK